MKRSGLRWLAASSLLLTVLAHAASRPRYGGTLRVTMHVAPSSLDPAEIPLSPSMHNLSSLIFDTLTTLDSQGRVQSSLASSWQADSAKRRWQFELRHDVKFHDGSLLKSEAVAGSLRNVNPMWNVYAAGESLVIETPVSSPNLPQELALASNSIVKRAAQGKLLGTGPFHIVEWKPGVKLTVAAEENYWGGRPFLDSIEIDLGKTQREAAIGLELAKADLIEVAPEQIRGAVREGRRVAASGPMELMALLFPREIQSGDDATIRNILALSIDRLAIRNVLLQGEGEFAGSLLPNWMTGYAFLFLANQDLEKARELRATVQRAPAITLGYDSGDPLARLVAERITLNARDAGLNVQVSPSGSAAARLVRVPLLSGDPLTALNRAASDLGLNSTKATADSTEQLYTAERTLLETQRVIPLFHLPRAYALGAAIRDWPKDRMGDWNLEQVWVDRP
jgi:peptide/nickel transport system substrate-binding protein